MGAGGLRMQTKRADIVHLYSALSWISKFYFLESYCISGGGISGQSQSVPSIFTQVLHLSTNLRDFESVLSVSISGYFVLVLHYISKGNNVHFHDIYMIDIHSSSK